MNANHAVAADNDRQQEPFRQRHLCFHYDSNHSGSSESVPLVASSPAMNPVVHVTSLEASLEYALLVLAGEDDDDHDDDAVNYPVKADMALLNCQRLDTIGSNPAGELSLLGLLEAGVEQVRVTTWHVDDPQHQRQRQRRRRMDTTTTSHDDDACNGTTSTNEPPRSLQRTLHHLSTTSNKTTSDMPCLDWIDMRHINLRQRLDTSASVLYFLRSLLGTRHTASPWYAEDLTADVCVVVVVSDAPDCLVDFRVGDASPSWYLQSMLRCQALATWCPWDATAQHDNWASSSSSCSLLVYRHLPPRPRLTTCHPQTQQAAPPGTLWETLPDPNHAAAVAQPSAQATMSELPAIITRLVSQPYLDALDIYPSLQLLLDNLSTIQREAYTIQHWTAWPEKTHYAKLNGSDATPWTVFPLCHCFPATDESKLKWIPQTTSFLPETTRLLQQLVPTIRTALLSRLEPQALLQAHTGWQDLANHVIRVHLPLQCPRDNVCGLWVDGCVQELQQGQLLAFDDSKVHWAFNYSPNQERVVLILDMVRPLDLPVGTAIGGHSDELDSFIESMEI